MPPSPPPAPWQDQHFWLELSREALAALRCWCAPRFSSNPLIPPRRVTLQCFGALLDFCGICSCRPATQPTTNTTEGSAILAEVVHRLHHGRINNLAGVVPRRTAIFERTSHFVKSAHAAQIRGTSGSAVLPGRSTPSLVHTSIFNPARRQHKNYVSQDQHHSDTQATLLRGAEVL